MTEEERREMARNNYTMQMNMLGYHANGNPKDMVEVIRCKDCKHRGDRNKCIVAFVAEKQEMPYFFYDNRGEWFCADGERK